MSSANSNPSQSSSGNAASDNSASTLRDRVRSLQLKKPQPVRKASSPVAWGLVLILSLMCAYLYFFRSPAPQATVATKSSTTGKTKKPGTTNPATSGKPRSAKVDPKATVLESKGYIIPEQQILVSPLVSARVLELNFREGLRVEKGFVLARLDDTEYAADRARVASVVEAARERLAELREGNRPDEIRQAQAELAESEKMLEQAKRSYDRKKELRVQNVISPQEFDDAESQYQQLVKRVEKLSAMTRLMEDGPRRERKRAAEAELHQAEAELRRANWRLENCTIEAPISGTILKKNAELGNLVNPVAFNGSFSLCDMADLSRLEVDLSIQERDIGKVFKGQRCSVQTEAYPGRSYRAYVSRLMPIADRAKGALPVRVRLIVPPEEEGQFLRPEMGAIVTFYGDSFEESAPAPKDAESPAEPSSPNSDPALDPKAAPSESAKSADRR